ncbi:hypothetical protein ES703_120940 [subsurface metagenome]
MDAIDFSETGAVDFKVVADFAFVGEYEKVFGGVSGGGEEGYEQGKDNA